MANFWEFDEEHNPATKPFWESDTTVSAAKPAAEKTPQDYAAIFAERARQTGDPRDIQTAMMAERDAAKKPFRAPYAGMAQGMEDPVYGAGQLGLHALPEVLRPNFLPTPQQFDTSIANRETAYQASRNAAGETGADLQRISGNIIGSAPVMALMPAAAPESFMGAVGAGGLTGGVNAALQPITGGDYGAEKTKQVLTGAGTGAVTSGLLYGTGRLFGGAPAPRNEYEASVQRLQQKGVTPTIGQMMGPNAAKFEDVAQPFSVFGQKRALNQVNTAAYETTLAPLKVLDQASPNAAKLSVFDGKPGREGLSKVYDKLSAAYDRVLPRVGVKVDGVFNLDLQKAAQEIAFASPAVKSHYEDILKSQILTRIDTNGSMTGEAFKALEKELSKQIGRLQAKGGDEAALADAFDGVLGAFRSNLERSNPQYAGQLQAVNTAYARFADVRRAVANSKDADGIFTPAGLWAALKAGDKSAGKFVTAEGKGGDLQELAGDALRVLGNQYPNSGTPARLAVGALEGGGLAAASMAHPVGVGSVAATGLAYTPWGQKAASNILGPRSGKALPLMGNALKSASPLLSMGTSQLFPRLMGP